MKRNRAKRMNETSPFLEMAGQGAVAVLNEEVETALHAVNWSDLEGVNLDAWFEKAVSSRSERKRHPRIRKARRLLSFAASVLLILIALAAIVFAAVEPARALLIRFIVQRFPQYSEYFIQEEEEDIDFDESFSEPSYIPEGFQLDNSMDTEESRFLSWINEETGQSIMYAQTAGESSIMLDTEDAQIEQLMINGHGAEVILKGQLTTVQFFSDEYCYALITDLSYDECMGIVESIPYLKQ